MRNPIKIPIEQQERRKSYYDRIYLENKDKSLDELKIAFNTKGISSTGKAALMQLTQELMLKTKNIDKPIELNEEISNNTSTDGQSSRDVQETIS